jgi:hypothetical protein
MKRLSILLMISTMIACSNKEKLESNKPGLISGHAYFKNKFAQDSATAKPLAMQEVFIKKPGDTDENYFAKVKTDQDGSFYINTSIRPIVVFVKTSQNIDVNTTAIFYGKADVSGTDATNIQVIAEFDATKQNGFILSLKDEATDPVAAAVVHVYNNQAAAIQNNPAAAISTLIAGNDGRVYQINLPAGNYYLNAIRTIDTIIYQRLIKQVTIPVTGLIIDTMLLKKKISPNGFTITVKDSLNGNVSGTTIHLYNNQLFANNDDPANAIHISISDNNGKYSKADLPAGTYYINAKKTIGGIFFQRFVKQITVPATGFVQDTMLIKPATNVNGFTMIVKDSLNGIIPGATIYLYNSQVLAASNDPNGAIHTSITNSEGKYSKGDLPAGNYYLNATKIVNSIIYQRIGKSIVLPTVGFITDTMIVRRAN